MKKQPSWVDFLRAGQASRVKPVQLPPHSLPPLPVGPGALTVPPISLASLRNPAYQGVSPTNPHPRAHVCCRHRNPSLHAHPFTLGTRHHYCRAAPPTCMPPWAALSPRAPSRHLAQAAPVANRCNAMDKLHNATVVPSPTSVCTCVLV
jgi:hypothetical protein